MEGLMEKIQVAINDSSPVEITKGTLLSQLLPNNENYICAKVNHQILPLKSAIKTNADIHFLTPASTEGMEVYRSTLSFLLEKAAAKLFPKLTLTIMHSLGAGYYYEFDNYTPTTKDIESLENIMRSDIGEKKSINRKSLSYHDAVTLLKKQNKNAQLLLLTTCAVPVVNCYQCEDFVGILQNPLAADAGQVPVFTLIPYESGFILQFPSRRDLSKPKDFTEQKEIFKVYREYKNLDKLFNVDTIGALNQLIINKKINDLILVEEALQESRIIKLAEDIASRKDVRLVAIAGPSSSGKTTFSKRLELQLRAKGLTPRTISVDDYFVDRAKTPLNEDGSLDFECIEAVNLELFNEHISALLNGQKTKLAHFDFITGKSSLTAEEYSLNPGEIIIIEGIHCLNEKMTYLIPRQNKYKIYISALTHINIDHANRIPTTDNRVIRRLVRDYNYRGHSAERTLEMWPAVRQGEENNIFPFQNDADGYFNSALIYELGVLKIYAEPILKQVNPDSPYYAEASRLLSFLSYFLNIPSDKIPPTSIVREFIGGSTLHY
jgi:uridine kinase